MRAFFAFFKKELLEFVRSGKLTVICIIFVAIGIMNPAIAKLTPWMLSLMSEELMSSGVMVTEVPVDALTSWAQFFKNMPLALIAFILLCANIFTKEYEGQTLVPVLTKGLSRWKVVASKSAILLLLWSAGYWLSFIITYLYNAFYWDNSISVGLFSAVFDWWLFGIFTVASLVFFSVVLKNYGYVLLGCGAGVFAIYMISFISKISSFLPTQLLESANLISGSGSADLAAARIITALLACSLMLLSVPIFNKKQI